MAASLNDATIVFDLDGTLVDTAPDLLGALNHVLIGAALEPVSMQEVGQLIGHGARRMIETGMRVQGFEPPEPEMDALLDKFLSHYADHIADRSRPFDGVEPALDRLLAAGARLAICTNKRQALSDQLLAALGLTSKFASIVGADSVPDRKPHPGHILFAIESAGGLASRAIMVGDSRTDERAARGAGLPFIFYPYGYETETAEALRPDAVLSHYSELFDSVSRLLP